MQTSVDALIDVSAIQSCRIAKIEKFQEDAKIFESNLQDSSDKDVTIPKFSALALACGKSIPGENKRKKH